jgi:DNA primase
LVNNELDAVLGRLSQYQKELKSNRRARKFLEKRGFNDIDNLIHRFKIGCSSTRGDYFDGYIVFPIFRRKKLKHMTARWYDRDYDDIKKHFHLYGNIDYYFNHDMIFRSDWLIVVESPICAMSLATCGYPAIAACGQGKTPKYFRDISKHQEIIIINDSDVNKAGIDGALKQAAMLKNQTNHIRIGRLPLPKREKSVDVNDYFRKLNRSEFENLIDDVVNSSEPYKGEKKKKNKRKRSTGDDAWRNDYDIVEILEEHVPELVESGAHYAGWCPMHDDGDTKSFVVYPDTQSWYCFGKCNVGGDVAKFFMLKENLSFPEALDYLKEKYS